MKKLVIILSLCLSFAGCSMDLKTAVKKQAKWVLVEWPGNTIPPKGEAFLAVGPENRIGGKSFCNTYGGSATFNGHAVQFSQLMGTKMYCNEVAEAENKFLADLQAVTAGRVGGGKLTLMKGETVLLVFKPAN